jgi:hypothetical protein
MSVAGKTAIVTGGHRDRPRERLTRAMLARQPGSARPAWPVHSQHIAESGEADRGATVVAD